MAFTMIQVYGHNGHFGHVTTTVRTKHLFHTTHRAHISFVDLKKNNTFDDDGWLVV